jgi:hypothetical protein
MKYATAGIGVAGFALLSGCSLVDAMHTASVYSDLDAKHVLTGAPADATSVALRTGQATFVGLGTVTASNGTSATAYLGDATVRVDFTGGTLTGGIDMYSAKTGLDPSIDPQTFLDQAKADPTGFLLSAGSASGHVSLTDGTISGAGFVAATSSGDLVTAGSTVVITGGMVAGEFTGPNADGLRGGGTTVAGTMNGATADQIAVSFAAAE